MEKQPKKPKILGIETIARSRLFHVESIYLEFSNGALRTYERMHPSGRQAVMIVPILDDDLLLIREYAAAIESYELGFPKGLIDPGEDVFQAGNRELMEEVGFGAQQFDFLRQLTMSPAYLSSTMHIVIAQKLYAKRLPGDEPEELTVVRWPISQMMSLLEQPDFNEARNVSALFLAHEYLSQRGKDSK